MKRSSESLAGAILVVMHNSSRGMPIARSDEPTPSSLS